MYQKEPLARDFYLQLCITEKWSTRRLKEKIDGLLFERTAISKKPELLAKQKTHENKPIGLILCAEGNQEQIQLLQLEKENIKVAEYITKKLPPELLQQKLQQFMTTAQKLQDSNDKS